MATRSKPSCAPLHYILFARMRSHTLAHACATPRRAGISAGLQYYSTPARITVHEMHFHYECNARGLDGKVDGNLPFCEIVCGIARNAPDGKADGKFCYKTYHFSEAARC